MERLIPPDAGETVWLGQLGVRFLLDGSHTQGHLSVVEHPLPARALGSPLHTHHAEDEWSFVIEGQVGVQLGQETFVAGPGSLVLKPRGVQHAFWNAGDSPARVLEMITPAGFERYFREAAMLFGSGPRDPARAAELTARYQLELDLASVPRLISQHGLSTSGT